MAEIGLNDLMTAIKELAFDMKEVKSTTSRLETEVKELTSEIKELKSTTSRLETEVKELKSTTSRLEVEVKELKNTTGRLETDGKELKKEMNHSFRRQDRKFGILTDELINMKTDITFLQDNTK